MMLQWRSEARLFRLHPSLPPPLLLDRPDLSLLSQRPFDPPAAPRNRYQQDRLVPLSLESPCRWLLQVRQNHLSLECLSRHKHEP
jgi:hypothetical protein